MIHIVWDNQNTFFKKKKLTLSQATSFKVEENSRTFQGLPLKFSGT